MLLLRGPGYGPQAHVQRQARSDEICMRWMREGRHGERPSLQTFSHRPVAGGVLVWWRHGSAAFFVSSKHLWRASPHSCCNPPIPILYYGGMKKGRGFPSRAKTKGRKNRQLFEAPQLESLFALGGRNIIEFVLRNVDVGNILFSAEKEMGENHPVRRPVADNHDVAGRIG